MRLIHTVSVRIKKTGRIVRVFDDKAKVWVESGYAEYVTGHFTETTMLRSKRETTMMPRAEGR